MAKRLTKKEKQELVWKLKVQQRVGEALIFLGLLLPALPFWPILQAEIWYYFNPPKAPPAADVTSSPVTYPLDAYKIIIPKIGVDAPIIADVDSSNYSEYMAALKEGVAHAKETAKPGEPYHNNQNTFLFAHSTLNFADVPKYNAVFIFLNKLSQGDRIELIYRGSLWNYEVVNNQVVEATDLKYLTQPSEEPILTLQTCDPPGTNLRRRIITAQLVDNKTAKYAFNGLDFNP